MTRVDLPTIRCEVGFLREAEVRISQGETVGKICRSIGVSEQTYYKWRREYGDLKIDRREWLGKVGVKTLYIEPGSPCEQWPRSWWSPGSFMVPMRQARCFRGCCGLIDDRRFRQSKPLIASSAERLLYPRSRDACWKTPQRRASWATHIT